MDIGYTDLMNILRIAIVIVVTIGIFGLPLWNLVRLQKKTHWLWMVIPPVFFLGIFFRIVNFELMASLRGFSFFDNFRVSDDAEIN